MTTAHQRSPKSEQLQASDAIDEVAPGILRTQLPSDLPGLGHVNMYVLEDDKGAAVIDPGLPNKESWTALRERLRRIGIPLRRVHTVVVTHSHPDHYGGASRLRSESGADIVTHRLFRTFFDPTEPPDMDAEELAAVMRSPFQPPPWGGRPMDLPWRRRARFAMARRFPSLLRVPTPSIRLRDSDRITLARRQWVAIHTPGHTEDHLCLFDPEAGVLLSGDHVLPSITPHISGLTAHGDPLNLFFSSLQKVDDFAPQISVALPAHGSPFANVAERVAQIRFHHDDRLQKLRDTAIHLGRPTTVMEYASHLFSVRAQGAMADSETYAHLEHLRRLGEFGQRDRDGILEYFVID